MTDQDNKPIQIRVAGEDDVEVTCPGCGSINFVPAERIRLGKTWPCSGCDSTIVFEASGAPDSSVVTDDD